jgi:DNA mismatch repair protein MSH2
VFREFAQNIRAIQPLQPSYCAIAMSALELLSQMKEVSAGGDDKDDHRTVVDFLRKLGRQPDDMLRFFDRNSYYTLHGRDADTVASEYFKSSACVRHWGSGDDRHPYLSINKKMGAEIIRSALLKQRRRVEVYSSDGKQWVLDRRGSPGNLQAFEEECLRDSDLSVDTSSVIVAVRLGRAGGGKASAQRLVGCAFVDCTVRTIRVSEFEDDEHLSTLESLICQQGTRECLLPAELTEPERAKLLELCELCEVPSTGAKKGTFSKGDVQQDLRRLLGARELHGRTFASESQLGLSAVCGLISYLELMGASDTFGLWTLDWVDAAQFMRLDAGAMRCLSVEPQPGEPERNASLLGLFSCCKTAMGARLLRKWLKQPLLSRHDIEDRLETVDALFQANETRQLLRDEVLPKLGSDF